MWLLVESALVWFLVGTQVGGETIRLGPFTSMQCERLKGYMEREAKATVSCQRDFRWEKETQT